VLKVSAAPRCGELFSFPSADGRFALSAVRIPANDRMGVVVMVVGRSESWLKYIPLFGALHRAGYTVYSYDHRGQGLSPHLVQEHPQIGHIDDSSQYVRDLAVFLEKVRLREGVTVNLIGHSMGAAVITEYLADHRALGVRKVVLCSPMFRINTAPWPEPLARCVLGLLHLAGQGSSYAPGEHDARPDEPFGKNRVTSSPIHWEEILSFRRDHPTAVTGGASVDWVAQALDRSISVREKARSLGSETLILQPVHDDLVIPWVPSTRNGKPAPMTIAFPESRHEILFEREPIRGRAVRAILSFLETPAPIPLDRGTGNRHTSGTQTTIP
jgi:lysophospholipase